MPAIRSWQSWRLEDGAAVTIDAAAELAGEDGKARAQVGVLQARIGDLGGALKSASFAMTKAIEERQQEAELSVPPPNVPLEHSLLHDIHELYKSCAATPERRRQLATIVETLATPEERAHACIGIAESLLPDPQEDEVDDVMLQR